MRKFIIASFCLLNLLSLNAEAQRNKQRNNDYARVEPWVFEDKTYKPNIRSVQLYKAPDQFQDPIIQLNSGEQIRLRFDDLEGGFKNYSYNLILCNSDWSPSDMFPNQYLDGFFDERITEFRNAVNTLVNYTSYTLTFPNENLKITQPGNYLLFVYNDFDKEDPILTRRFYVTETRFDVRATLLRATRIERFQAGQELDFIVNTGGLNMADPFRQISLVVRQNNRWDNQISLKPLFVNGPVLTYDYDTENVFNGGNEYRYLDLSSVRTKGERVRSIEQLPEGYFVTLLPDESRRSQPYVFYPEMNGKFASGVRDGIAPSMEADYMSVKFTLNAEEEAVGKQVYVLSAFNDFRADSTTLMKYNQAKRAYELVTLMKQGFHNYQYLVTQTGTTKLDETYFEGNFYETENDYHIFIYYRELGGLHDKLYGYRRLNTIKN